MEKKNWLTFHILKSLSDIAKLGIIYLVSTQPKFSDQLIFLTP